MTRLWPNGYRIQMETGSGDQPVGFTLYHRRHRLVHIHQQWEVDTDWWQAEGRVWRSYWAVQTSSGLLCVLYHDRLADAWFLSKLYD